MEQNNRNTKRITKKIPIRFGRSFPKNIGYIKDLSIEGVALVGRVTYQPETNLDMSIGDESRPILIRGMVKWVREFEPVKNFTKTIIRKPEMGVQFLEKPRQYMELLEGIIEEFTENRRDTRVEMTLKVTYDSPKKLYEEYTHNISMGGMFIMTTDVPKLNSIVKVNILLGDILKVIHAEAKVVHVVDTDTARKMSTLPGIGVQFTHFKPGDKEALTSYINSLRNIIEED